MDPSQAPAHARSIQCRRPAPDRAADAGEPAQRAAHQLVGAGFHYLEGQWPKLVRFVQNGTWPLDSNPVENAIRPLVVGRKGRLFADTVGGANASANLYSLVETAKANGIEPYRYLVALFKQLPLAQTADEYEALLPWDLALPAA